MISGLFFLFEGLEDVGMVLRTVRYENGTKTVRYVNEYQVIFDYGDFRVGLGKGFRFWGVGLKVFVKKTLTIEL